MLKEVKAASSPIMVGTMRLGTWGAHFNDAQMQQFIDQCIELKAIDFDLADIYGHYTSEAAFGAVLQNNSQLRTQLKLTTKCGIQLVCEQRPTHQIKSYNLTKAHIIASVEQSLKNLHTDYIDILLLHRPDYLMNPPEIAEAFEQLEKDGKVLGFGVSNFSASQFNLLNNFTPLLTNQIEISALHLNAFEDGTLDQCLQMNLSPTAWSPVGGGTYFADASNEKVARIKPVVQNLANAYNCTEDMILLAWLKKHPAKIVPVIGTSKIERVKAAMHAQQINISHEDWYKIWQASKGEEVA